MIETFQLITLAVCCSYVLNLIGRRTINIPEIILGVHGLMAFTVNEHLRHQPHPRSCIICTRSVLILFDRMASGDSSALLLEKVSCPECKGTFKNPKRLPCLHSVCLPCLEELQRKSSSRDTIVCPTCNQESKIEGGNLEKLPDSPYITSLCEVLRIMKSKTSLMKCLFCDKEPTFLQGTYKYCSHCRRFLCDPQCLPPHRAIHGDSHRLLPWRAVEGFQEGAANDYEDILKPCTYCLKQNHRKKELKLFCTECKAAICSFCSHTDHEKHTKVVLGTAADERKTQMEAVLNEQLQEAKKKGDEITQLREECDEVDRQAKEVVGEVNDFFRCISERLEREKKTALDEAEDVATRSRELLEERKRLLQNQEDAIRITMDTTSMLLKHCTSVDVIDLKNALDAIVREVEEEETANKDPERKPLQISFVKSQDLFSILDTRGIGFLQTQSETSVEQSTVDGEGITAATVGIEARFRLTTKNTEGNHYRNKIDRISVAFRNEKDEDCATGVQIQDNEDGSYAISYFAKENGAIRASVKVNGAHVSGSPFDVEFKSREFRSVKSFGQTFGDNMERWGLAVSHTGEIAVTQSKKNVVQLFRLSDTNSILSFRKRGVMDRTFDAPAGIVFDKKGRILVADSTNGVVHIFTVISGEGKYEGKFGERGDRDNQLTSPHGLSIGQEGNIIVSDTLNMLIKIFSPEGKFLRTIGKRNKKEKGSLNWPCHCVQCGKYLAVSETFEHAIKVFDQEGGFLYQFGTNGIGEGQFIRPRCLAVDKLGHLLVCDPDNKRVQIFELDDSKAIFKGTIGTNGEIMEPFSAGVLSDGRIVVNDIANKCIQIIE